MTGLNNINQRAERINTAAKRERLKSPEMIQKTKATRYFLGGRVMISMFQVQSITAADGIYLCRKQTLAGGWGTYEFEVLNLIENDTITAYTPMLAFEDRIAAWEMADENGAERWVGVPIVPSVRMARVTEASPNSQQITCNLIANDGETEITSGLGSAIEVFCKITEDVNLNAAVPRFKDNDYLFVQNISGKWWCTQLFQASENCICSEP